MWDACRPAGRLFYWLLIVMWAVATTHAAAPGTTTIVEGLFGSRSGTEKKDAALSFVQAALSMSEALTNRQIVDEARFKAGLGQIVDGTVECLNASIWAKAGQS
jgi:hypothetical protein